MRTLRRRPGHTAALLALATGLTGLVAAQPASASPGATRAPRPGQWTQVTGRLSNINDVGLARGRDGVLHVLWTSGKTGSFRVQDTPVTAKGVVGKTVTIRAGLFAAGDPDATATPKGLDVFWNEVTSSSPGGTTGVAQATRPLKGGSWKLGTVTSTTFSWQSSDAAAPGTAGKAWVDFANSNGIAIRHTAASTTEFRPGACCVTSPGIGTDAKTGAAWITYLSTISRHPGLFALRLNSSGQRSGSPLLLPGSDVRKAGGGALVINQRVTATGLGGMRPGVYVTYRTGVLGGARSVKLYRLGAKSALTVASFGLSAEVGGSTLAADPFGRVWVSWFRLIDGRPAIALRRAKAGAAGFGQVKDIVLPKGTQNVWKVYLNPQARNVDVMALLNLHGKDAYWTTQITPPRQ